MRLHSAIFQKAVLFIFAAMGALNLTKLKHFITKNLLEIIMTQGLKRSRGSSVSVVSGYGLDRAIQV
jgi:hypothetical protein